MKAASVGAIKVTPSLGTGTDPAAEVPSVLRI